MKSINIAALCIFSIGCGAEEYTSEEVTSTPAEDTSTPVPYTPENGGVLPYEEIYYVTVEDSYTEYRYWYQDQVDANTLYFCNFFQTASYTATSMPHDLQLYGCNNNNMSYHYTYYNNYKEAIGWLLCGPQIDVYEYAIPCNYNVYTN